MPVRRAAKLTVNRRADSLGPIRKADPTSGATFNVQVVKGKMSGKCLMHACRALSIGLFLMFIGAGMATIGYYTNTFAHELRTNGTVAQFRYKNENRGLHLNNLSYLGPIVMGVGGFIVVAACVITFEMRDSAAKVMPARFKVGGQQSTNKGNGQRPSNTSRTRSMTKAQWEQQLGVFRTSPAEALAERRATTAALVHFSKTFGSPKPVPMRRLSKSDSVPHIFKACEAQQSPVIESSPIIKHHRRRRRSRPSNSLVQRSTRDTPNLLHPSMMQFHKAAISFDESGIFSNRERIDSLTSSPQGSVKFDLTPMIINDQEIYRTRMKPKRSDTARRHVLSRQRQIEDEVAVHRSNCARRRNSAHSESPIHHRRSRIPRQNSSESRASIPGSADGSPSPEQKFRSQISVCSEPPPVLSCQSSIEPVVPEENTTEAEKSEAEPEAEQVERIRTPKKLHRSSSTKSYKEKKKLEIRKNNEIERLFAMQSIKNRMENEHDIEVISERRLKNFKSEPIESPPHDTTTVQIEIEPPPTVNPCHISITIPDETSTPPVDDTDENRTEKEVIK